MDKGIRYSDEFKQEAVNRVSVHGYSVAEVSERLGISTKSLYDWLKHFSKPTEKREEEQDLRAENARLKRKLKRSEQERHILKEAAVDSNGQCNSYIKRLICIGVLNEADKTYIYPRRESTCF